MDPWGCHPASGVDSRSVRSALVRRVDFRSVRPVEITPEVCCEVTAGAVCNSPRGDGGLRPGAPHIATSTHLTSLASGARDSAAFRLLATELRLALKGYG